jgi:hypothetical protein
MIPNNGVISLLICACKLTIFEATPSLAISLLEFPSLIALSEVNTWMRTSKENPDGSEMSIGF